MNRDKKSKRSRRQSKIRDPQDLERSAPTEQPQEPSPAAWVRYFVSIGLAFHLIAIATSFLAVIEPSETHSALLKMVDPYLRLTHFGADGRPVYLAHAEPLEQPHRLQVQVSGASDWITIQPSHYPGLASADRYSRWLSSMAAFAENDRPSLVAEWLIPEIKKRLKNEPSQNVHAVRIIRIPTELTTLADDALPAPYLASVVLIDGGVNLVQVKEERLNARSEPNSKRQDGRHTDDTPGEPQNE